MRGYAWERLHGKWNAVRRSRLFRVQVVFIHALDFLARSALMAAMQTEDARLQKTLLRAAERSAHRLLRQNAPWEHPLAQLVLAGAATIRGDRAAAMELLSTAHASFQESGTALFEHITDCCRGLLAGGEGGAKQVGDADAWLRSQSVARPELMAAMMAPGMWTEPTRNVENR